MRHEFVIGAADTCCTKLFLSEMYHQYLVKDSFHFGKKELFVKISLSVLSGAQTVMETLSVYVLKHISGFYAVQFLISYWPTCCQY